MKIKPRIYNPDNNSTVLYSLPLSSVLAPLLLTPVPISSLSNNTSSTSSAPSAFFVLDNCDGACGKNALFGVPDTDGLAPCRNRLPLPGALTKSVKLVIDDPEGGGLGECTRSTMVSLLLLVEVLVDAGMR